MCEVCVRCVRVTHLDVDGLPLPSAHYHLHLLGDVVRLVDEGAGHPLLRSEWKLRGE